MKLKLILDVNIIHKMMMESSPSIEVTDSHKAFNCITHKKDFFQVLWSWDVQEAYEDHFKKTAGTAFMFIQLFMLRLGSQLLHVESKEAPCRMHPDDQCYLDCAHGGQADIIISYDRHFKDFDKGECNFQCFTATEFLKEYCPEYI